MRDSPLSNPSRSVCQLFLEFCGPNLRPLRLCSCRAAHHSQQCCTTPTSATCSCALPPPPANAFSRCQLPLTASCLPLILAHTYTYTHFSCHARTRTHTAGLPAGLHEDALGSAVPCTWAERTRSAGPTTGAALYPGLAAAVPLSMYRGLTDSSSSGSRDLNSCQAPGCARTPATSLIKLLCCVRTNVMLRISRKEESSVPAAIRCRG